MNSVYNFVTKNYFTGFIGTVISLGVLVAIGLFANNADPQHHPKISPLNFNTTAIGPFTNEKMQAMFEEWRLAETWASSYQYMYTSVQIPLGGNQIQDSDPVFGTGPSGFNVNITNTESGFYAVLVVQETSGLRRVFAFLFDVVATTDNDTDPQNQVIYPNTYKLSYIGAILNVAGNGRWYY